MLQTIWNDLSKSNTRHEKSKIDVKAQLQGLNKILSDVKWAKKQLRGIALRNRK